MLNSEIISILLIFFLNILSNTLGNLKTIFVSKQIGGFTYILVGVDALFFSIVLKAINSGDSLWYILAYVFGKIIGAVIADILEKKLALGVLEVTVYERNDKAIPLADTLRELGYSVTTSKGYGQNGKERFIVTITISRKEYPLLGEVLNKVGITKPNMIVKEVKSIEGKCARNIKEI